MTHTVHCIACDATFPIVLDVKRRAIDPRCPSCAGTNWSYLPSADVAALCAANACFPGFVVDRMIPRYPSSAIAAAGGRDELFSEAASAMLVAARRFCPTRLSADTGLPFRFITFAYRPIERRVHRFIARQWRHSIAIRLDDRKDDGLPLDVADVNAANPADQAEGTDQRDAILAVLNRLEPRRRKVIELCVMGDAALREAAVMLGVSNERARQLRNAALTELRCLMGVAT